MWCAVVFSDVMLGCVRAGDARECYAREGTRCSRACDCGRGGAGGKGSRLGNTGSQIVSIEMCNCMVTVLDTLESAGLEHVLFRMCARNPPDNRQPWLISHAAKPACSVSHGRGGIFMLGRQNQRGLPHTAPSCWSEYQAAECAGMNAREETSAMCSATAGWERSQLG
jgi:hypothetical protein